MKDSFFLRNIKTNKLFNISDSIFHQFFLFSKKNSSTVPLLQIFEKLIIIDLVISVCKKSLKKNKIFEKGSKKIMEIGSGSGLHSALLSNFGQVSATELKHTENFLGNTVDTKRKLITGALATDTIDFRYNNGTSLPFDDESFDIVFHNSVIEHVPDINSFNQEVHRVLKPGGICICITGTPILCLHRFIKYYLLRFPLTVVFALLKASIKTPFARLALMKKIYALIQTRVWHFSSTADQIKDIVDKGYKGESRIPSSLSENTIKKMYPSLLHFIRGPEYNQILLEKIALHNGISPRSLLLQLVEHFKSPWNEFIFTITPQTHSQYTQNYKTEIKEWGIKNWIKSFKDNNFSIRDIRGCRYGHIFDITYNYNFNIWLTYQSHPLVHTLSRCLPAWFSGELIILAQKMENLDTH